MGTKHLEIWVMLNQPCPSQALGWLPLSLSGNCSRRAGIAPDHIGELIPTLERDGPILYHGCGRTGLDTMGLGDMALPLTTQTHVLGLGLGYPNSCLIFHLLECANGLVLQNINHRVSMTLGSSRISEKSLDEGTAR